MFNTKRMSGYLFAFLAVVQMAAFFLYQQTTEHLTIQWLVYLVYWIRALAEAIVPLFTAAGVFLLARAEHRRLWLFPILPVLSRALYYLPDHYLDYLGIGFDSGESISIGLLITLAECAAIYGFVFLLYFVARYAYRHASKENETPDMKIFALDDAFVKSVFFISLAYFCLQILIEILRMISYLTTNAGTYLLTEIFTLIISFVMHFALLFGTHALCILYLRYSKKHYTISEDEEAI